ncbi:MAG: small multi-drug export protein [Sulfolobales archaeon]|nr:small multi-drug export protein [Sulfolobales archaeon]MCX8186946.1 small multi-drug export protein [Sulfolobales archaeon]MDW7970205.1 small multi-drug export protein [Sulfolobales archaeon]
MDEFTKYLLILLTSLAPGIEVRGSIPLTFILFSDGLGRIYGTSVAVIGNLLIAPPVIALLKTLDDLIRTSRYIPKTLRGIYVIALNYARIKSLKVRRYSFLGLMTFTAVPLPGTGAWTASLISFLIGMDRVKAVLAIEVGVLIASLIVAAATYLGLEAVKALFLIP